MTNVSVKKAEAAVVYPSFQINFDGLENFATAENGSKTFRASVNQIKDTQSFLKETGFYKGEITGKLNRDTRNSLKKFQKTESIKITGTINAETFKKVNCFVVKDIQPDLFDNPEEIVIETTPDDFNREEHFVRPNFVNPNYRFAAAKTGSASFLFDGKSDYLAIAALFLLFSLAVIAAFAFN
jgi:peptidoglycan hydrolase-like protein with peptidoglycan-binding domain